ncbi:MAG: hypothetical protein HQL93_12415 [Magnetococcales bacterium]|nr:hypothetical protein [Magnetococcales bacterium]
MRTGIRELIQANNVSVRLWNCITNHELLPLETVGEYIQAGDYGMVKMLCVPNLGKKTAIELDVLIKAYVDSGIPLPEKDIKDDDLSPVNACDQGRNNILQLLENIPLQASLMHAGLEKRTMTGVETLGDVLSIGEFVLRYNEIRSRLLKQINFGRTSLKKLEAIIEYIIRLRIQQVLVDLPLEESVTFDELINHDLPESTLHRFASMDLPACTDGEVNLEELFSESAGIQQTSQEEHVNGVVLTLPEKEKEVILRRYGIDDFTPQALEDIAKKFSVTRERVRQVESGAIRRLKIPKNAIVFQKLLASKKEHLWSLLSNNTGFVSADDLDKETIRSEGLLCLALDVIHDGIHGWLKTSGRSVLGGWLRNDIPVVDFKCDVRLLEDLADNRLFPTPIELAYKMTGMDPLRLRRAIRLVPTLRLFEGYCIKGHLGAQAKRTIRLYKILSNCQSKQMIDFRFMLTEYNRTFPEAVSLLRIAELTMERNPHLFKKVFDNFWVAIPLPDILAAEEGINSTEIDCIVYASQQEESNPTRDAGAVTQWLINLLDSQGPMRFYNIKEAGQESMPEGISLNSLGPILQTSGEFIRLTPGVYGLPKHLFAIRNAKSRYPISMMTKDQCEWYTMSRKAGEPISLFPAWDYRFERALCYWAWGHCSSELFGSLLTVADPSKWECPPDELEKWRLLKKQHRRYTLGSLCQHPLDPKKVTPDQLFSALLLMRATGGMSWISFNRATLNRIDSHKCVAGLVLLVAMEALQPTKNWQDKHLPGPEADRVADILSEELAANGKLSWNSDGPKHLLISARDKLTTLKIGWIDVWAAKELIDRLLEEAEVGIEEQGGLLDDPKWSFAWENDHPKVTTDPTNTIQDNPDTRDDLFFGDEWDRQWDNDKS